MRIKQLGLATMLVLGAAFVALVPAQPALAHEFHGYVAGYINCSSDPSDCWRIPGDASDWVWHSIRVCVDCECTLDVILSLYIVYVDFDGDVRWHLLRRADSKGKEGKKCFTVYLSESDFPNFATWLTGILVVCIRCYSGHCDYVITVDITH